MPPKKKTKEERFAEAEAIIAAQSLQPGEKAKTFAQGKDVTETLDQPQRFQVDGKQVSREELKAEVERRKGQIAPEGGRKAISPEQVQEIQDIGQQAQAPTEQPGQVQQADLRLDRNIARLGLAVPTAIGNTVTSLLESITGKKFGRTTTTELAQTGPGEVLGLGIVGTALAAGGFFAYETYLSGLSAQQLINIAGTKALPTSFRLPAISSLTKLSTRTLLTAGGVFTVTNKIKNDAKKAIIGNKEMIDSVLEDVALRGKSFSVASQELDEIEANINHIEGKMKFWQRLDITYILSGGLDDQTDVKNVRNYLNRARFDLAGVAQQAILAR